MVADGYGSRLLLKKMLQFFSEQLDKSLSLTENFIKKSLLVLAFICC